MLPPITAGNDVDPTIWRAIAGNSVQIPAVGSRVYYFPQGHAEHATSGSPIFLSAVIPPFILCRVLSVRFLADSVTDEAFAKIFLHPINQSDDNDVTVNDDDEDVENDVVSFVKILTPSDANNGGGFSVPRFCADSVFPRLNFVAEPPVQNLAIRDIHGGVWEFRHIYRGTPRRHLLTTGWSKFVNSKKLVAGDSAVFIRKIRTGELYVGVRRATRGNDVWERWTSTLSGREQTSSGGSGEVRWRTGQGRVATEAVAEAADMVARGMPFEVSCYPRAGWADFVVRAEAVEASSTMFWTLGTRVKMAVETEDSSRTACFQGTVSSIILTESGPWRGSPWRMLQITWDEPEVLQHAKRVNPWQVERILPTPQLHYGFPPSKKIKLPNGLLPDGDGKFFFPMTGLSNPMIGLCSPPSLANCTSFPAGMQGARQNQICVSSLSNVKSNNNLGSCTNNSLDEEIKPQLESVSTKLNIGSSYSGNLSPDSQSSVHFWDDELVTKPGSSSLTKVHVNSFQLFGKVIHVEGGFDGFSCSESDSIQVFKEIDGAFKSNVSPNKPCIELLDNLDVQHQRDSAVEACSL